MQDFEHGALKITIGESSGTARLAWSGKSEDREPGALLTPYLQDAVREFQGKTFEVDFTKLEYMNSSTVPPIIHFIKDLESSGSKTTIFYDKDSKWQAASFKALETISTTMKHITVQGA